MKHCLQTIFAVAFVCMAIGMTQAGIYSTGGANTNPDAPDAAIHYSDSKFVSWVTEVIEYAPAPGVAANWQNTSNVIGPVGSNNMAIVSLGDLNATQIADGVSPGYIVLAFLNGIGNGIGADFAAFENAMISGGKVFAELAYVEVSTDGVVFSRFPSISETPGQVGGMGTVDPTGVYNLVGKHTTGYGTPFDLDDLLDDEFVLAGLVDLNNINYVRLVDIPGDGTFKDSLGNSIYDAWVTTGSGGLDFAGIGVINERIATATPEPGTLAIGGLFLLGSLVRFRREKKV